MQRKERRAQVEEACGREDQSGQGSMLMSHCLENSGIAGLHL